MNIGDYLAYINGKPFFTAQWVIEQMSAQSGRIDRANRISWISLGIAGISLVLGIFL